MASAQSIKDTYDNSIIEIQKVLFTQKATAKQKKVAKQSLKDLTTTLLIHNLKTIEGRTAILSSLIVELHEVIDSVQTKSSLAKVTDDLTVVLKSAKKLFTEEKKRVISG